MKFDPIKNPNYVATIVRIEASNLYPVEGLDNLVGYTKFGMQALVPKEGTPPGLYLLFSTEVQLSQAFAHHNNLFRDSLANADQFATGYLEDSRRVKAIKLRKNRSDSLVMPLSSLSYLLSAKEIASLQEGDVFDSINGHEICRKYVIKETKQGAPGQPKARVRRVDAKVFPEHLDSENYFRNCDKIPADAHVTVSQKLHGTSVRYGNVPVATSQRWWERLLKRPVRLEHKFVVGSRRVVKSVDLSAEEGKHHYYGDGDLWTRYADKAGLRDRIPKDHLVYGELIGFSSPGSPIQKGYTYHLDDGEAELYVYRVAVVTSEGRVVDYSPKQMEMFCIEHGLKMVPVIGSGPHADEWIEAWLDARYYDLWIKGEMKSAHPPLPLSDKKTVDEGVCVRYDGPHGVYILKAKSPLFLEHETKLLDAGAEDLEAAA